VLAIGEPAFRDPKVFWHDPSQRWVMVVALSNQHKVSFYASPDLKGWQHLSDFGPAGSDEGVWECPDLFQLPLDGTHSTRWVLKVDVGGKGGQYFVGEFNGERFTCEHPGSPPLWVDGGADFYAAQSWSDLPGDDDSRLWLAWMVYWSYAALTPTSPWRGMMTCPREVRLCSTPSGPRLAQAPAKELQRLRGKRVAGQNLDQAQAEVLLTSLNGASLEIIADLIPGAAGECGFKLRVGEGEATLVGYDANARTVFLDRAHSGNVAFAPDFAASHSLPVNLDEGNVRLHILVDTCSVEVFASDGLVVISDLVFPSSSSTGVGVFSTGSPLRLASLQAWQLSKEG
jgi:fructan beta-fructosidase